MFVCISVRILLYERNPNKLGLAYRQSRRLFSCFITSYFVIAARSLLSARLHGGTASVKFVVFGGNSITGRTMRESVILLMSGIVFHSVIIRISVEDAPAIVAHKPSLLP